MCVEHPNALTPMKFVRGYFVSLMEGSSNSFPFKIDHNIPKEDNNT